MPPHAQVCRQGELSVAVLTGKLKYGWQEVAVWCMGHYNSCLALRDGIVRVGWFPMLAAIHCSHAVTLPELGCSI